MPLRGLLLAWRMAMGGKPAMVRAIPMADGAHGRDVLELTLAIEDSAMRGGEVITLPLGRS